MEAPFSDHPRLGRGRLGSRARKTARAVGDPAIVEGAACAADDPPPAAAAGPRA